ncbi:hypothetical protein AWC38_SpisGene18123 [Stylophora pistillata]|uniref:Uncharacterized protein n=1 Tax=Stylophora pistillata TaxID=50429 RepID=A0A2B4RMJ1_STYPI|nr:hypothetical protein AWC38_SpisGene18123 [Stylophora pistillata]
MFVREKHLWKRELWCRSGSGFPVKAFVVKSEVVEGISAPLDNDFWYRYQKQDFEEATRIALEASLNDLRLRCKSESEDSLDKTTPGFNHARGRGKMLQKTIDVIGITDLPPKKKNKKASRKSKARTMAKSELESDVESLSEGSSSSQDDKNNKTKKKQRKISLDTWDNVEMQSVGRLPVGIDGLTICEIKGFVPDKLELLQDGRKWKKTCLTFWRRHARTRFADCKGSVKCTKEHCPFKMQFGVTNTTQFEKKRYGKQVWKGCGSEGEFVPCAARRYLSYGKNKVTVYHIGEHSCPVTSIQKKKDLKAVEQLIRDNPIVKPCEIQSTFVLSAFQQEMDWDEVEKEAAVIIDKKRMSNIKQKVKREIEPFGYNFEAVVSFKECSDKRDLLYIYKQIPLAIMETEREDTTNVELFRTLFNEALGKVANDPSIKFNPIGWCSDMAGANLAGITRVYGNAGLIKSCEFHFMDHRNKKAQKLDPDSAEEFKRICDRLLHSTTAEGYESAKGLMDKFVSTKEERDFSVDWVSWWHDRRGFIFRAFAVQDAPQRRHASQINKARSIGKEMFADDNEQYGLLIDPQSSHHPGGRKKSKRNSKKYLAKSEINSTPTLQQPNVVTPMAPQMSSAALQLPSPMLPQNTLIQGSPRILAPQLSARVPFQTPLCIQPLQVTPSPQIYHRIPMQVPPPVPPIGTALPQQAPAPSWNAGMPPNAYEVVFLRCT